MDDNATGAWQVPDGSSMPCEKMEGLTAVLRVTYLKILLLLTQQLYRVTVK